MQATYQTRISCDDAALSVYAALYGRVQRNLFAEVSSGRSAASMKRDYVREYGIPAQMFNAVRVSIVFRVMKLFPADVPPARRQSSRADHSTQSLSPPPSLRRAGNT